MELYRPIFPGRFLAEAAILPSVLHQLDALLTAAAIRDWLVGATKDKNHADKREGTEHPNESQRVCGRVCDEPDRDRTISSHHGRTTYASEWSLDVPGSSRHPGGGAVERGGITAAEVRVPAMVHGAAWRPVGDEHVEPRNALL